MSAPRQTFKAGEDDERTMKAVGLNPSMMFSVRIGPLVITNDMCPSCSAVRQILYACLIYSLVVCVRVSRLFRSRETKRKLF